MKLLERFGAWRKRRYWTAEKQLEHLRLLVQTDHRWMSSDKTADALTTRYLAALEPDWYQRVHEDVSALRSRIGLEPTYSAFKDFGKPLIDAAASQCAEYYGLEPWQKPGNYCMDQDDQVVIVLKKSKTATAPVRRTPSTKP